MAMSGYNVCIMTEPTPSIVLPPKAFLDLNHVIEICRIRAGKSGETGTRREAYELISEAARTGRCTVLFNPAVFMEQADTDGAQERCEEIAAFFESCLSIREVETQHAYLFELLEEVRRHVPDLPLPRVPVVRPVGDVWNEHQAVLRHHPAYPDDFGPRMEVTVRTWMAHLLEMARVQPHVIDMRKDGWRHSVEVSRPLFEAVDVDAIPHGSKVNWAKQALELHGVLASAAPDVNQEAVLPQIDFDRCKACRVYLRGYWHYTRHLAGRPATDNDADDWIYVPAVAYADLALIERAMCHHLVSANPDLVGRVLRRPEELVEALGLA